MNRIEKMKQLKQKGLSYVSIGKLFDISRQRVHQLITDYITPTARKTKKYKWLDKIYEAILKRDNYKCQICERKAILVHHIDKDNSNNDPKNLISLCQSCHGKLHSSRNDKDNKLTPKGKERMIRKNTKERIKKYCPNCGKEFEVLPCATKQIYCSISCANIYRFRDRWKVVKCKRCHKEIKYLPSQFVQPYKYTKPIFCSRKCWGENTKEKTDKKAIEVYKIWIRGVHYKKIIKQFNCSNSGAWGLKKRGEKLIGDKSFDT